MQHNGDQLGLLEPSRDIQENGLRLVDRDALLDAKDQTIFELKEQVAFLRRELERKHEIILCMAEASSEMSPSLTSEVPDGSQKITRGGGRDGDRAGDDAREGQEKPER